jgi:hypothetical protein
MPVYPTTLPDRQTLFCDGVDKVDVRHRMFVARPLSFGLLHFETALVIASVESVLVEDQLVVLQLLAPGI